MSSTWASPATDVRERYTILDSYLCKEGSRALDLNKGGWINGARWDFIDYLVREMEHIYKTSQLIWLHGPRGKQRKMLVDAIERARILYRLGEDDEKGSDVGVV